MKVATKARFKVHDWVSVRGLPEARYQVRGIILDETTGLRTYQCHAQYPTDHDMYPSMTDAVIGFLGDNLVRVK